MANNDDKEMNLFDFIVLCIMLVVQKGLSVDCSAFSPCSSVLLGNDYLFIIGRFRGLALE